MADANSDAALKKMLEPISTALDDLARSSAFTALPILALVPGMTLTISLCSQGSTVVLAYLGRDLVRRNVEVQ